MKPFTTISIVVFALIALMQLVRLIMQSEVTVDGVPIPIWASGIALALYAGLTVMLWRERNQ